MIKQHKDKIFIFAMVITLANIIYWTFYRLLILISGFGTLSSSGKVVNILVVISGAIAIWAILYLIRQNRNRTRAMKNQSNNIT